MSIYSSRKSVTPSSILKRTSLKKRINTQLSTPSKVRFILPHAKKAQNILRDYARKESIKEYENLVCRIRDSEIFDDDLLMLITEANECVSLLNRELWLFIEALLSTGWLTRDDKIVSKYQSFIVNLVAAHNYHAKFIVDQLVSQFVATSDEEWTDGTPGENDCKKYGNIHTVLKKLLKAVPMCKGTLKKAIVTHYPYLKRSTHIQECYIYNLLWILQYSLELRPDVLHLIFSKLVIIDVHIPKDLENEEIDQIFSMETDTNRETDFEKLTHTLDICMNKVFQYFINECYDEETSDLDWDKTKDLYQEMIVVFDNVILPTYNTHYVQYSIFFLISFKTALAEAFLSHLWHKVCNPNVAQVFRRTAVNYLVSLLARANFIPMIMIKSCLQQMSEWIHSYIATQDGLDCVNSDIKVHSVFYTVCQALFYVVAFRYKDFVTTKKNLTFLESLNMGKMVTSRLNPLRVCHTALAQNFAAVTRQYQLAYCHSIMEHNSRNNLPTIYHDEKGTVVISNNSLEAYYPFDPYTLSISNEKIEPLYKHYQEQSSHYTMEVGDTDDFLEQNSDLNKFSYATSPGFKFK